MIGSNDKSLGLATRENVKARVDRLSDEQVFALWIIIEPLGWPAEEISAEEALEIAQARAEI
ncbi:MAG TPA: hypothetical protein DCZ10_09335 [Pelotomaculum sp.]|nr:hypothetical protein [Pelotomaculum sp.]